MAFALLGCRQAPTERIAMEAVVQAPRASRVTQLDVSLDPSAVPQNSYVTLVSDQTEGLFPASLAFARVNLAHGLDLELNSPVTLAMQPMNELADWMSLFDDTWRVSEVFPVTFPIRKDRPVVPAILLEQAREDGGGLCLIYSIACDEVPGGTAIEVKGTLYDTYTLQSLALIQSDAVVHSFDERELLPPLPPPDRIEADRRHIDPWFLAQDRFRELARSCVLDLVVQDQPAVAPRQTRQRTARDTPLRSSTEQ